VDHRLHRVRRAAVNPFFSKQSVARLQPMLNFMLEKFSRRIEERRQSEKPIREANAHVLGLHVSCDGYHHRNMSDCMRGIE
jgi:hypothetical protein